MLTSPGVTRRLASRRNALSLVSLALGVVPCAILLFAALGRAWVDDDAFIDLRVVRNVLDGAGPVYNAGERVEASTSPLWIAVLVVFGRLGLPLERAAAYGGIALAVAGLAAAQRGARATRASGDADPGATSLPLGALVFAVVPVAWDYASSGLEMGLAFAWLGASYAALARVSAEDAPRRARVAATAMLVGLGPLVRPELALYAAAMLGALVYAVVLRARAEGTTRRATVRGVVGVLAAAAAAPLAYEIFRMGYYAALVPNTALAKEAFAFNVRQGVCYAKNFFGLYVLGVPLAALAWFFAHKIAELERAGARALAAANVALPAAAVLHAAYVVAIGGDYMHGRMFLPVLFAAIAPVATVTLRSPEPKQLWIASALVLVVAAWLPVCGLRLRVDRENQYGIGDERGWYARMAGRKNPIALDDYRDFSFYRAGAALVTEQRRDCPDAGPCVRALHFDADASPTFHPPRTDFALDDAQAPAMRGVVTETAIGIVGYLAPADVHVLDRHGLADPIGARLALGRRGRPGHEKVLSNAWIAARFTRPEPHEDAAITAARRALACGELGAIDRAVHAPLTASRFVANVRLALATRSLRVPPDPFDAEARFCRAPAPPIAEAGGHGGAAYRWSCPDGERVSALRVGVDAEGHIATFAAACASPDVDGPAFGDAKAATAALRCDAGEAIVGVWGSYEKVVRRVGPLCASSAAGPARRAGAVGAQEGDAFEARCPDGLVATGIAGRAGDLVDAAGVVCGRAP